LGKWFKVFLGENECRDSDLTIEEMHDYAYSLRRAYKKLLEEAERVIDSIDIDEKDVKNMEQVDFGLIDKYQERVSKLGEEVARLEEKRSSAEKIFRAQMKEWQAIGEQIQGAEKERNAAKKELNSISGTKDPGAIDEKIEKIDSKIEKVHEKISKAEVKLKGLEGDEPCPEGTCARASMKDLNGAIRTYNETKHSMLNERNELSQVKSSLVYARTRLERAEEKLEALPAKTPPKPEKEVVDSNKISQYTLESKDLEGKINALKNTQQKQQGYRLLQGKLEENQNLACERGESVERLKILVDALNPNGIKAELIKDKVQDLEYDVNEKLEFFGMEFGILVNPWMLMIKITPDSEPIPCKQASWSEKGRISAALQVVIAEATGFNLIAIDEHGLDISIRPVLLEFLMNQNVQSIVLSTSQEMDDEGNLKKPVHPGIDGLKIFFMEKGVAEEVKAA